MRPFWLIVVWGGLAAPWVFSAPPADPAGVETYQVEEYLAWPEAAESPSRPEAETLLARRRELIATLDAGDFRFVPTPFGDRPEEPAKLAALRKEEHARIRRFLPAGAERRFREFRADWQTRADAARQRFPREAAPAVTLQVAVENGRAAVEFAVGALSPHYRFEIDKTESSPEGVKVYATWHRPSVTRLIDAEPARTQLAAKAEVEARGTMELWLRPRDEDYPYRTEYVRVLSAPLGG